jgi:8-oxo-dGTP pyrophosphatase MutT (NUDIX family)
MSENQPLSETRMTQEASTGDLLKQPHIRAIAICVFRNGDRIFVPELSDPLKKQTFYRPLGGSIEFGERSHDTVARELREEIDVEVSNLRYIGTIENIFTYNGQEGHEIVQVYEGDFADRSIYEREYVEGREGDGTQFKVVWKSLDEFSDETPLYPDGLMEVLRERWKS